MIRSSTRRLAVSAGLAVLLLTGCGQGEVRPGAAALVGEQRISTEELEGIVERGLADPQAKQQFGADLPEFQRQALGRLVSRRVLEAAAEREGVTVDDGDVDAQLERFVEQAGGQEALEEQAAQSGIAPQDLRGFLRDVVLDQALADELTEDLEVPQAELQALYDQNIGQFDKVESRHILVADEARARSILEQVREDPSQFAALAAQFSTDESNKDNGGDLGAVGRGQFVPEFEELLFSLEPGGYDVVQTQFGWHVVHVVSRETTSLAEATPDLRRGALQEERQQATQELLQEVAADLGIEVNPRFGRWDADTGRIVPLEDPTGATSPAPESEEGAGEPPVVEEPEQAPLIEEAPEPEPAG